MFRKGRILALSVILIFSVAITAYAVETATVDVNKKAVETIGNRINARDTEKLKLNKEIEKINEKYKEIKTPSSDPQYRQQMNDKKDALGKEYKNAIIKAGDDASKVNQDDYVLKEEMTKELQDYYAAIDEVVKKYDALEEENMKDREEISKLLPKYTE